MVKTTDHLFSIKLISSKPIETIDARNRIIKILNEGGISNYDLLLVSMSIEKVNDDKKEVKKIVDKDLDWLKNKINQLRDLKGNRPWWHFYIGFAGLVLIFQLIVNLFKSLF